MEDNLKKKKYVDVSQAVGDLRLVWRNALKYNKKHSQLYDTALGLARELDLRLRYAADGIQSKQVHL